ncbi:hypothetical protein PMIN01_09498 [Paraphaeosphaeria minitans]|uniref:Uncharacterized protein n=1 Tax=Paraphaeosphaeria minitans TaxID=565426 RepID=A0A9P6KN63_9PLEO|nr:hypothetical protein PMIN01_09498 [Paraphaeosphaeria minitans]
MFRRTMNCPSRVSSRRHQGQLYPMKPTPNYSASYRFTRSPS